MTTHRKLAAILAADAAGYSRLMADDEAATLRSLNDARGLFRVRIEAHGGRLIDTAGDSILAEFPSAVEAVDCADEIQHELAKRNHQLAEHRRMQFRIGINLGDVIGQKDGTIYGDGVNVSARLQALAEPGGICISGTAFDQVEGKLPLQFKFIGEQQVKNIAKPVRAYRVLTGAPAGASRRAVPTKVNRMMIVGGIAAVLIMVLSIAWKVQHSATERPLPAEGLTLAMPSIPSIAVLPFTNMSGDAKQEYFADGITEDIITALSKVQRMLVIARNSAFQYKGKAVDIRQVSRDLGVRHVLEGSVRKEGNRVRVTAQLIDAVTGAHVWSERYDRPLKDIFTVQDEITRSILVALDVKMVEGEQARVWRKGTKNMEAYEHLMRGRELLLGFTKEDFALAREEIDKAIRLDPHYGVAYNQLVSLHLLPVIMGFSDNPKEDMARAFALERKAIELDDSQGYSWVQLGRLHMQVGEIDKAIEFGKKAVALEPNGGTTNAIYGHILEAAGRPEEALSYVEKALRLSPVPESWIPWLQGLCLSKLGRHEAAIAAMKRSLTLAPRALYVHVFLANVYVAAGRDAEARAKAQEVLNMEPSFSVERFLTGFNWYKDPEMIKGYAANLRKAGLK